MATSALMQPLDDRGAQREADPAQRLGVGHLAGAHVRELPVDQVGPHLALEHAVAPVAHVLEHQQPQHHVGRRAAAPAGAAVRPAPRQRFVDQLDEPLVGQQLVDVPHPAFPQRGDIFGDRAATRWQGAAAALDHREVLARALARRALARCLSRSSERKKRSRLAPASSVPSSWKRSQA